ncbi:MAG TPA: efflux RND transporter periplasmic adaptor subunit [Candidatus Magasanikbacteria bacterium]|nr:efflux RND transporter periplasmic adaptor subunit [Candidatus Magasanikbacteria bacterium]
MKKIFPSIAKHKKKIIFLIIILGIAGYYGYQKWGKNTTTVRHITAQAERGVLIQSISGTGQVSASNQVSITPKVSGEIISVKAKIGDEVKSGAPLLSINAKDALKTVRDAEANLAAAKLSLQKIEQPTEELTILQAENSLLASKESKEATIINLTKTYDDSFNTIANAFLNLPNIMSGMEDLLYGKNYETYQENIDWYFDQSVYLQPLKSFQVEQYRDDADNSFKNARTNYDKVLAEYKTTNRSSSTETIENLLTKTYDITKQIADAIKSAKNYIDFVENIMIQSDRDTIPATLTQAQTSLTNYTGLTNTHLLNLLSITNSIASAKTSLISADRTITEKTASLENIKAGTDPLDVETAKLTVKQRENSLIDAREKLADYSVRAPFDGVLATFTAKKGDTLSSGATIGTLITKQKIATISLNEVDAAKVKVGQKATISFDAIENLEITGEVTELDALGTVTQGVVSYSVKIAFDIQDERVKPGMSVSVTIILSSKPDVLLISSSAIKTKNGTKYVEVLENGLPTQKTITTGDSNDTQTEILSGIGTEENVITQTITTGSSAKSGTSNFTKSSTGTSGRPPEAALFGAMH